MFSSTIDYRWHIQRFPQDLNRRLPFNPLHCFAIHFETIVIWFLCVLGCSCISRIGDDSSLADSSVEMSERGHAYIKQFSVGCSAICITSHCYQLVARISIILHGQNCPMALWEGDLSLSKVYKGPLGYTEGSPLTLCNH